MNFPCPNLPNYMNFLNMQIRPPYLNDCKHGNIASSAKFSQKDWICKIAGLRSTGCTCNLPIKK